MRVHLLATPNGQTTRAYALDGFLQRAILFAELLKRLGHEVILYGSEENDAPCDQFISCISKAEQAALLNGVPYQSASWEAGDALSLTFNTRAANHLRGIKQPRDIIASIAGSGQAQVTEAHPELLSLEYSVGYKGVAPKTHRVYQSVAWQHIVYGFSGVMGGRDFDTVIPPWFNVDDFPFTAQPDPYVVYCGRLVASKGIATACEAAKLAGVPLVVIGHGDEKLVTYGDYRGAVSTEERNRLLSRSTACLMPTQYIEPFGNVAAEAQLCGTPVISTDFGAFPESVEQDKTGYRCSTLGEFVQAIHLAPMLDRFYIRQRARRLYGMDTAADSYRDYFAKLASLRDAGWRTLNTNEGWYGSHRTDAGTTRLPETPTGWSHVNRWPEPVPCAATA